jgi:osmotically-inducible protein OsmY
MKTDTQLQQDVLAELKWEPSVHAAEIGVEVKDGVVTLAGEVSSFTEKWAAEKAAQRVSGVMALAIEIEVKLSSLGKRTDADIARSAQTALGWSTALPLDAVKVMVEHGQITLSGAVDWQFQKQAATDSVRHLSGVVGVLNQMVIEPQVSISAVKADIEAALKRVAKADARKISVSITGSHVTLSGTVGSWSERELAMTTAWRTPGVSTVVDSLTLVY